MLRKTKNLALRVVKFLKNHILFIFLSAIYVFLLKFLFEGFPDLLGVSDIKPSGFFGLVIGVTATVFSILMAVILLVFQLTKNRNIRRDKRKNTFNQKSVVLFLDFSIFLIIAGILSYILTESKGIGEYLCLTYFLTSAFIAYILVLFPFLRSFLKKTDPLEDTLKVIENMDYQKFLGKDEADKYYLNTVYDELDFSIREQDYIFSFKILKSFSERITSYLDEKDKYETYRSCFQLYSAVIIYTVEKAIMANNLSHLENVWGSTQLLFKHAAKNKKDLSLYQDLVKFVKDYILLLLQNNKEYILSKAVNNISEIFKLQLKDNCPIIHLDPELYSYEENTSRIDIIQWETILRFLDMIQALQKETVSLKNKGLYKKCAVELSEIIMHFFIPEYQHLTNSQRSSMTISIVRFQCSYAEMSLKDDLFDSMDVVFKIDFLIINNLLAQEDASHRAILSLVSDLLIKAQRNGWIDRVSLASWGNVAREFIEDYEHRADKKEIEKIIRFIIDTYKKLKKEAEADLAKNRENYIWIYANLLSIKKCLLKKELNIPLLKEIEKLMDEFIKSNDIEKDASIVDWD